MAKTIAVLAASGFEQGDMTALCRDLAAAGHRAVLVSTKKHEVRGWDNTRWGGDLPVDVAAVDAAAEAYDALVIPGGVIASDTLRSDEHVVRLVAKVAGMGRPVAAMGHAPWVLVEAGLVKGRNATSHPAIRTDLANAGAAWRDQPAVDDGGIITGRHSHDMPAFAALLLAALGPG